MAKKIEKRTFQKPLPTLKRVAAYARVSSAKDAMHHSLSAQVSYYSDYIQKHPGWQYAGVYADEAKTGTKDSREGFMRLLSECRKGNIDIVVTKSVSRFARNTVTLLETVRELKSLGIDVFFEEQDIHTLSSQGELMLSILASFAQAESLSASENQKWRIRKNFEEGKPWCGVMLGYRQDDGRFVIVPEEAEIVKRIYSEFLSGKGIVTIVNGLNEDGVLTQKGFTWHKSSVLRILRNYNYTGNLLLQRFYSEDHITKRKLENNGELPRFLAEDTHEAIISLEDYEAVQAEIKRRAEKHSPKTHGRPSPFTGKIVCENCGKHYRRKVTATGPVWICSTYNEKGKAYCASKAIPEATLTETIGDMPFDSITACSGNRLAVRLGSTETTLVWKDRSRADSWSEEMRKEAGRRTSERSRHNG
jgi:DNA invertase Pin-like site-specific DNA recombinase